MRLVEGAMSDAMRWAEGFIAVDWGTTNRRAYLLDSSGTQGAEFEDAKGVLQVNSGEFPAAVAEIRNRLGDKPLLMAGMIGSNRGWVEAPYVPCPAGIEELARGLAWPAEGAAIVPGVSFSQGRRADVMRGEEVQLLGAFAGGQIPADCVVCHPGTHNKWATLSGGRITRFRTVMTGELFNLIKAHSILSDLLTGEAEPNAAFAEGVRAGLTGDGLPAELFAVRARVLLGEAPRDQATSFASGLLIGTDVAIGLRDAGAGDIIVMGRPELTQLYAAAIQEAGRATVELDGERSFVAGSARIVEMLT
jgi:2-dehydro-3-deoxygalactonokinase